MEVGQWRPNGGLPPVEAAVLLLGAEAKRKEVPWTPGSTDSAMIMLNHDMLLMFTKSDNCKSNAQELLLQSQL